MTDPLPDVLQRYWGYTSFRPLQHEAMGAILAKRDSLVVLPTGGGKSLCFQAPALVMPGVALVVSPLIALMKDQVDGLVGNGVPAASLHSGMSASARDEVMRGLGEGRFRLLYVAPERVAGDGGAALLNVLARQPVSFIAVDEAHCISQWGHNFRPEYRQLASVRARWPTARLHAFTATATARVREDIVEQLALESPVELVGTFDRPNLRYRVLFRSNLKRQLQDLLDRHRGDAGIIYCPSRREVDALANWLVERGVSAVPYHAGLADDVRERNQDAFINEAADVVVATVAFGMGIDRSDVRFVAHAGAPQSLEHYQQEAGRAGRDGLDAECVLIYSGGDFLRWRTLLERGGEWSETRRLLLRDMERYAASVTCRHRQLVGYFGERYPTPSCRACDVCLGELEPVADATTIARKILSAVARVGQRFGAAHVTNILLGRQTPQVLERGHERLTVFGLMPEASIDELRGYIDQLLGADLLRAGGDAYPILQLTSGGVALLKDAAACPGLVLARQQKPERRAAARQAADGESWVGVDRQLFDRLRAFRHEIARTRHVPPYVVFHDATLREIARLKPSTMSGLRQVYGIGTRKAEDLGEAILDVIRAQHS